MARKNNKGSVANVDGALRQRQAVQLRVVGYTYQQIAQALGYADAAVAYNAVKTQLANERHEAVEDLREVESKRLDALTMAIWPRTLTGDPEAVRACLAIAARRSRLFGLDLASEVQRAAGAIAAAGVQVLVQINNSEPKAITELTDGELVAFIKSNENGEKPT